MSLSKQSPAQIRASMGPFNQKMFDYFEDVHKQRLDQLKQGGRDMYVTYIAIAQIANILGRNIQDMLGVKIAMMALDLVQTGITSQLTYFRAAGYFATGNLAGGYATLALIPFLLYAEGQSKVNQVKMIALERRAERFDSYMEAYK